MVKNNKSISKYLKQAEAEGWRDVIRTKADERALLEGYYFDQKRADHVCTFYERFLHTTSGRFAGIPFKLTEWQRLTLRSVYGWRDPEGNRRFQLVSIWIPKKNGKTTFVSGLITYELEMGLPGGEFLGAATTTNQAEKMFNEAKEMINLNKHLKGNLTATPYRRRISCPRKASYFNLISSDDKASHGYDAPFILIDELHAHRNKKLFEAVRYAGIAQEDSVVFTISTAGNNKQSFSYELYKQCKSILAGHDETLHIFPLVYELPENADIYDEDLWPEASPGVGDIIPIKNYRKAVEEIKLYPSRENAVRQLLFNQWVGSSAKWIPSQRWAECGAAFSLDDLEGRSCCMGLDFSVTKDITALVLCFYPTEDDPKWYFYPFMWIPKQAAEDYERELDINYKQWSDNGDITLCRGRNGKYMDYEAVHDKALELAERFDVVNVVYDPKNAQGVVNRLEMAGMDSMAFSQYPSTYNEPTQQFEQLLNEQKLVHPENPCFTWQAENVELETTGNDLVKPVRPEDRANKIDAIQASVMALGAANLAYIHHEEREKQKNKSSVYSDRGAIVL